MRVRSLAVKEIQQFVAVILEKRTIPDPAVLHSVFKMASATCALPPQADK